MTPAILQYAIDPSEAFGEGFAALKADWSDFESEARRRRSEQRRNSVAPRQDVSGGARVSVGWFAGENIRGAAKGRCRSPIGHGAKRRVGETRSREKTEAKRRSGAVA